MPHEIVTHAELLNLVKALLDAAQQSRQGEPFPPALIRCAERVIARADAPLRKPVDPDAEFNALLREIGLVPPRATGASR